MYVLFRTFHFVALLVLTGAVIIENMAVKPSLSSEDCENLAKVDRVAGIAAVCALLAGLSLWLLVGKPAEFYSSNPIFHIKTAGFALLVLCATRPAVFFLQNKNYQGDSLEVPRGISLFLKIELALLAVIALLGMLMARGVGL